MATDTGSKVSEVEARIKSLERTSSMTQAQSPVYKGGSGGGGMGFGSKKKGSKKRNGKKMGSKDYPSG